MKLSTKTRYGMRAAMELAKHEKQGPVQLKLIAEKQDISLKYLEQLMAMMKAAGIIRSIRGAKGGYVLAKPASQIRLSQIFTALEGPIVTVDCLGDDDCEHIHDCPTRCIWQKVQDAILEVLNSMTLEDLAKKQNDKKTVNYQI